MQRHRFVKTLDARPKILLWDADLVFVGLAGFIIGVLLRGILLGAPLGIAFWMAWSRLRAGGGTARAMALMYWHLPLDWFERLPASSRRHFIG